MLLLLFSSFLLSVSFSDEVVAVVDGEPIVKSFVSAVKVVFDLKDENEALDFVIDTLFVLKYAEKKLKYVVSDEEIDEIIRRMGVVDMKEFEFELLRAGMTLDEYRNFIKAKKISDMVFFELTGGGFVSDEELLKFYKERESEISQLFEMRYVLYKEFDADTGKEEFVIHDELKLDLSEFSEMGWVRKGELKKEFDEPIFSLPSTGFTPMIISGGKKIIFFVSKIKKPDFSELKNKVDFRDYYIKIKYKEVFERWVGEGKKELFIELLR